MTTTTITIAAAVIVGAVTIAAGAVASADRSEGAERKALVVWSLAHTTKAIVDASLGLAWLSLAYGLMAGMLIALTIEARGARTFGGQS